MAKRKADQEKREAEEKADREVATRLEANQMRLEPETEHQEKMDAWIAGMKDGRKETTAYQDAMEADLEKMEPDPGKRRPQWSGRRFLMKRLQFIT
jgi:saccharopine dehydrogenase-like NADP-dependent oxidoreductase